MRKEKDYPRAFFSVEVVKEAYRVFWDSVPEERRELLEKAYLVVETADGEWKHDTEDEFFSDYRKGTKSAWYQREAGMDYRFRLMIGRSGTSIEIGSLQRFHIESVFEVFEKYSDASTSPKPESLKPKIFIGHGRSFQWRDLKDHL